MLKGDQQTSRAINRRLIINHLRRFGEASRNELVEATGLSGAAVTFVTAELIDEGLVAEQAAVRGARRRPIDINYTAHFAIGLKLMERRLQAVLTDLSTRALTSLSLPIGSQDPTAVADVAAAACDALLERTRVARSRLAGIGLGLPGVIDFTRGVCVSSHRLGWVDVPIAEMIAERAKVPVWADNDVNAFALAEHLFGNGRRAISLVAVTIGRGVGAGIVLDGRLYHGYRGAAGEFGHIPMVEGGRLCECGRRGCLEAYVAEPALLARMTELAPEHASLTIESLAELATVGDDATSEILGDAGRLLGRGLAALVNLFDPEVMVIGGEGVRFGESLFGPMRTELDQLILAAPPAFAIDVWDDDAWARGAAGLAIQRFFDFEAAQVPSYRLDTGPIRSAFITTQ
jgi:predicted NBD/HSP70 family sugar kinase